eukprot:scaffold904_cov239-Pinguiococcus_pyrenoidosus.AAC.8
MKRRKKEPCDRCFCSASLCYSCWKRRRRRGRCLKKRRNSLREELFRGRCSDERSGGDAVLSALRRGVEGPLAGPLRCHAAAGKPCCTGEQLRLARVSPRGPTPSSGASAQGRRRSSSGDHTRGDPSDGVIVARVARRRVLLSELLHRSFKATSSWRPCRRSGTCTPRTRRKSAAAFQLVSRWYRRMPRTAPRRRRTKSASCRPMQSKIAWIQKRSRTT